MDDDRPRFVERIEQPASPETARQGRSSAMITIGLVLFVLAGYGASQNPDGAPVGVILLGMLAVGLIVGGLVVRR